MSHDTCRKNSMPRTLLPVLAILWIILGDVARADDVAAESFFETNVRPVLVAHCAKCHGADKQSGNLRVDSRAALVTGGDRGPAIVPGDAEKSLLMQAVRRGDDLQMPPDDPLPAAAIADLTRWIQAGAAWPASAADTAAFDKARHWAFQPVVAVEPPADATGWATTPIDRFIAAGLAERGLKPAAPAAKHALLRRAYFDLIGLPPAPEEIAAFETDDSPDAFARVVEHLLASPRYGERWGRHWMDVVRYADTAGDNADYPIPEAHLYRDYIIAAFNNDKPYDQFLREQLAGDILAAAAPDEHYAEQVIATGFIALSRRYGTMPVELWQLTLEDTIDTFGQAFLGLTLRCARCHDHKFDPVTTADYYALYGIFDSTQYPYAGSEEYQSKNFNRMNFVPLVPAAEAAPKFAAHAQHIEELKRALDDAEKNDPLVARLAQLDDRIAVAERRPSEPGSDDEQTAERSNAFEQLKKERKEVRRELDAKLKKLREALSDPQRSGLPADVPGAYAVSEGKPHDVAIQKRGEPSEPGPVVPRNAPRFLRGERDVSIPAGASGRQQLAEWLTDPLNPLTARVLVNRVWQWHFGRGLVVTPSNFGLRGAAPTHPALLDWLAHDFVEHGWSIKSLHRAIMLSRTYQMSSNGSPEAVTADPANQYYARFDRRRLDAEALRDAVMSVAGTLDLEPPAAHPFPPLNEWHWTQHNPFKTILPSNKRSVYLMTQRLQRHPYLALFDGPDTNYSTGLRTEATVPLQALYFLNNPGFAEQAEAFAARLIAHSSEPQTRVEHGMLAAWSRAPEAPETENVFRYLDQFRQELDASGCTPEELEKATWTRFARVLLSANEFLYVD
jgi:mono/diheme cytochrome c family protein